MTAVRNMTQQSLERALRPYLKPGVALNVVADEEGVLQRLTITDGKKRFFLYGDAWTWEDR